MSRGGRGLLDLGIYYVSQTMAPGLEDPVIEGRCLLALGVFDESCGRTCRAMARVSRARCFPALPVPCPVISPVYYEESHTTLQRFVAGSPNLCA